MSQHWLTGKMGLREVDILIGWDEPLQHFFMTIDPELDTPIYSNLHEMPEEAFTHTLEDYQHILNSYGVTGVSLKPGDGLYEKLMDDKATGRMASL